jgi:hypothetical protein
MVCSIAALGGIELDQGIAGLDLLAFLEADLADDSCHLGGHCDRFIGTHRTDRFPNLDDASSLHRVHVDRRWPQLTGPAATSLSSRLLVCGLAHIRADHGHLGQMAALVGVPAAKACCPQHGNDSELTGHTHARSLLSLSALLAFSATIVGRCPSTIYAKRCEHNAANTMFCITIS